MKIRNEVNVFEASDAVRKEDWTRAVVLYTKLIFKNPTSERSYKATLDYARYRYRLKRLDEISLKPMRVGIAGYELSHNPAGRVIALAELYEDLTEVEVFGSLFPSWGSKLWHPIASHHIKCHSFVVQENKTENTSTFLVKALELVLDNPYDIVHLSKPRGPNLIFGLLYKWVWGARVIMDIDDEELGFLPRRMEQGHPNEEPIAIRIVDFYEKFKSLPSLVGLARGNWTRLSVGAVDLFDEVTVSNRALQKKYGGIVLPHTRKFGATRNKLTTQSKIREELGIPTDAKVVLFFGTPRRHKGIIETAKAVSDIKIPNLTLVFVGDFTDVELKAELLNVCSAPLIFLPSQPYTRISDISSVGDYTVLLQDTSSIIASFQVPAKLSDALASGTLVFANRTPALEEFFEHNAVVPVTQDSLSRKLQEYIIGIDSEVLSQNIKENAFSFYEKKIKASVYADFINHLIRPVEEPSLHFSLNRELEIVLNYLKSLNK